MIEEEIHDVPIHIHDHEHHEVKNIIKGWQAHQGDFKEMRHAVDHDPNRKIYMGGVVFEKKDGNYIVRKSKSVH